MVLKRMLVAHAEPEAWEEFRLALGESWSVVGADSAEAALAQAQEAPFDVVVANYELSKPGGGVELLNQLAVINPKALRFIAADAALKEKVMCSVVGGHQFLALPIDRGTLKSFIERSLRADYGMSNNVRDLVSRIRTFPTMPSIYLEVVNALKDPNAGAAEIGAIIARDMSMTTKLVQVINSAYFGLPRTITDPTEAVGILGFETVKSLIVAVKLLSQYDKVRPVYFSIDSIWRHSTNVARTARVMALLETNDPECSSTAYTAGLMHDLGKVILAANFDSQYHGVHNVARKEQIPLWEVEKDIFGATHGEIGAYLLSLWGLSDGVVRVAAMHHHPSRAEEKTFSALTAVHVANVLEYEANPEGNDLPPPVVDLPYLQMLGMEDRVELWRFARREPEAATAKKCALSIVKPKERAVYDVKAPVPEPEADAQRQISSFLKTLGIWMSLGVGASIFMVFLARWESVKLADATKSVHVNPEVAEVIGAVKDFAIVKPLPAAPAGASALSVNSAPTLRPAPPKNDLDRLELQAIFFSTQRPSALINGKLTGINQLVADCKVLDISPSSVTVEHQNQRKTLTLR